MKRSAILLLLVLYVFTATECRELLKLPVLIEHFTEHQTKNSNLSLFDFINLHYLSLEKHGDEDAHDHALPFKAHENCHSIAMAVAGIPEQPVSIDPQVVHVEAAINLHPNFLYTSYSATIWQPPKTIEFLL